MNASGRVVSSSSLLRCYGLHFLPTMCRRSGQILGTCDLSPRNTTPGLVEDGASACPSSAHQKVRRDGCGMFNPFGSGELMGLWLVVVGPIDEQRSADEILTGSGSPEAAVVAVVTIVAHHEKLVGAERHRAIVVAPGEFHRIGVHRVRFSQLPAVDVHVAVTDFQSFTGQSNDAFHKTQIRTLRRPECHDFTAMDR